MGLLLLTAYRRLEVAQALAQRTAHLGQTLRTQHKKCDNEDEQKVCWLKNVADHARELSR